MSQDSEPSIIDYARFHGLACDHRQLSPLQGLALPENQESSLDDPPGLVHFDFTDFKVPEERLAVDACTASLVISIADWKQPPVLTDQDLGIERHRVQRMKLELPLLRSDHELDVLNFATPIVPDLENEFLPLETVDIEEDEGLEWPSRYYALVDDLTKKSTSEKLAVSKDDLLYLQDVLNLQLECAEHATFEVDDLLYMKKPVPEPASPPLLPLSPSPEPYVPSSETGRLELLSDVTSPTREEAREVERKIFAEDRILPVRKQDDPASQLSDPMLLESESLGDIYSPLRGLKDPPSSPPAFRERPKDLKVEVPSSSQFSDPPPLLWERKSVSFSEALPEIIRELPPLVAESQTSEDIDAFFEQSIKPVAIKAERATEQEQLEEADTKCRVQVPIMDLSLPIAPWEANSHGPNADKENEVWRKTLSEMKELHLSKQVWSTSVRAERELKWAPFPVALGKVEIKESIPDDGSVEEYIGIPERVDVDTLTWKPDGLRMFDDLAESEKELEEADFPEEKDIDSLVRKRKLELEADDLVSSPSESISNAAMVRSQRVQNVDTALVRKPDEETARKKSDEGGFFSNTFSAMGAVDDYMSVRKGQMTRRKLTSDHYFARQSQLPQPSEAIDPDRSRRANLQVPSPRTAVLPSPVLSTPSSPHWFIISASFLNNRRLSRQVQRLYPSAEYIERDFTLHQQQLQQAPLSNVNGTRVHFGTMADEADMLLSPSTGLIWTTLQKIKQRSLPGQPNRSAARERISRTSPRYERLLILVSQNWNGASTSDSINNNVPSLDSDDCTALADFIAFCSALPDEVQTTFVAGGEEDLAKWIVAAMVKHGMHTDREVKLLQDETVWEIFLRRAGVNAFAAQAILATLKAPSQNEGDDAGMQGTDFGLAAFVKMSVAERFARFETLLGGRRVLGRVSEVLDARW